MGGNTPWGIWINGKEHDTTGWMRGGVVEGGVVSICPTARL